MSGPTCIVCLGPRRANAVGLCVPCARSYEETDGGDMLDVVRWAVERARFFDGKRATPRLRPPASIVERCVRCGKKGAGTRTGTDGDAVLCKQHLDVKPCSICGSIKHTAAHQHPEFWASRRGSDAK